MGPMRQCLLFLLEIDTDAGKICSKIDISENEMLRWVGGK